MLPDAAPATITANAPGETDYRIVFQLGPRDYTDFEGGTQTTGARTVQITGDITAAGAPIGFCSVTVSDLPPATAVTTPATFAAAVRQLDYTAIPVNCPGPAAALAGPRKPATRMAIQVHRTANATVDADRDTDTKSFAGTQTETLDTP